MLGKNGCSAQHEGSAECKHGSMDCVYTGTLLAAEMTVISLSLVMKTLAGFIVFLMSTLDVFSLQDKRQHRRGAPHRGTAPAHA